MFLSERFLPEKEVEYLSGKKRKSDQINWLRKHRYPFEVGDDGKPKVLIAYVEQRLGKFNPSNNRRAEPDEMGLRRQLGLV